MDEKYVAKKIIKLVSLDNNIFFFPVSLFPVLYYFFIFISYFILYIRRKKNGKKFDPIS